MKGLVFSETGRELTCLLFTSGIRINFQGAVRLAKLSELTYLEDVSRNVSRRKLPFV